MNPLNSLIPPTFFGKQFREHWTRNKPMHDKELVGFQGLFYFMLLLIVDVVLFDDYDDFMPHQFWAQAYNILKGAYTWNNHSYKKKME